MAWSSALRSILLASLTLSCVIGRDGVAGKVIDLSFSEAEAETRQALVFFAAGQDRALRALLESVSSFSNSFVYVYVDCNHANSKDMCQGASFTEDNLPRVFVNSVEGGIESISGPPDKAVIEDFLEFRSSPVAGERVIFAESSSHVSDLMQKGRHVVVKHFITSCVHCKRYKKHFEQSSTLFGSSAPVEILFVEIDCGKLSQVCRNNGVSSYPTIQFFDANNNMQMEQVRARDHGELTTWLKEHAEAVVGTSASTDAVVQEIDVSDLADDVLYSKAIEMANANMLDETVLYFRELQVRHVPVW